MGKSGLIGLSVLVVILAVSNLYTYTSLQNQITNLTNEKNNLQAQVNMLIAEKTNLQTQLNTLNETYLNYKSTHSYTNTEYDQLKANYLIIKSYYRTLSNNVTALYDLLCSYSLIPEAFARTLNNAEVRSTSSAVLSAVGSSTDYWSSIQKIYNYIVSNIKYVEDIDMPYPYTRWYINIDGVEYIVNFTMTTHRNYVQTPSLTLEIKQGDCDDQAILAYAMIKYYMKYIYLNEFLLYITYFTLADTAHLAVIMPVQGGKICIIDPAGHYLTSQGSLITSKQALSELQAYSNYWSTQYGSIKNMKLYEVSVEDGSYRLVAEGNINQVAEFLAQR